MPNIRSEIVERYLEAEFLAAVGGDELLERVVVAGSDNRDELESVKGRIGKLAKMFEAGVLDDDEEFAGSLAALKARRRELEASPVVPDTVTYHPTGVDVFDAWEEGNADTRRGMLFEYDARVAVRRDGDGADRCRFALWVPTAVAA
jgi:hypothetical protein